MRKVLNFVKGAVSTKDLIPVLTNFHFYAGRVQGGNGRITIDAPLDIGCVDTTVPAVPFLRATDACDGQPELSITEAGRLMVRRGKFKSSLPLSPPESFPRSEPTVCGSSLYDFEDMLRALKTIRPFVGEDASRPWVCGVLLKDGYMYATNNVVMARIPFSKARNGYAINLPSFAVDEILRINEVPTSIEYDDVSMTLHYGDRWLRSHLFDAAWPDVEKFFAEVALQPVPAGLLEAVEKVLPFCPDAKFPVIRLSAEGVHTADGEMSAQVDTCALPASKFRAEILTLVLAHATAIDLSKYPAPIPFSGMHGLRGVLVGIKQ